MAGGLLLLGAVEEWPRYERPDDARIPGVYGKIALDATPGALCELNLNGGLRNEYVFYQTLHGRPLVDGHLMRPSPGARDFVSRLHLYERLGGAGQMAGVLADMGKAGVAFVVLHREGASPVNWNAAVTQFADHAETVEVGVDVAAFRLKSE